MKDIDFDKTWIGSTAGILAPVIAFVIYYLVNYRYMAVGRFIDYLILGDTYTAIVTLCLLANLGAFYLFIWKEKYVGARGVLASTFIWAAVVMYLKFFTH
ncbi:MAG: hypothetical protein V4608_02870 [Bacteroidota bacterium]